MKKKELKNLAEKIAQTQVLIDTTSNNEERKQAQRKIIELTGQVEDFEDFFILDELIQKNIKKILDKK